MKTPTTARRVLALLASTCALAALATPNVALAQDAEGETAADRHGN